MNFITNVIKNLPLKILAKHENERRDAIIESAKKYARKMSEQ